MRSVLLKIYQYGPKIDDGNPRLKKSCRKFAEYLKLLSILQTYVFKKKIIFN